MSRDFCYGRKLGLLRTQNPCNCLFTLRGFSFMGAKAAIQAPGDPQPPPKPAPPPRSTHEPIRQVVDEHVKVVGVENVAGSGIQLLDCALSVNEIKGLPAIAEDVCSVRARAAAKIAAGKR